MIGRILGGRYEIVERLGSGGMSVVYKANCTYLRRQVAVKILHEQYAEDDEFLQHFRREAWAAARLSHPNIVNIYDVGEEPEDNIYYIVMEYVPGEDLRQLLRREERLSTSRAVGIALEVLKALKFAHTKGVVHRDIKPDNIIVDENDRVKVMDFGIARAQDLGTVIPTNKVVGSARYMSPEQARGKYTDARSDLYSLGIVLYQMLTGQVPFDGDSSVGIALEHINQTPVEPKTIHPDIPSSLNRVIMCALEKDPERRYPTAQAMGEDLVAALKGEALWADSRSKADDRTRVLSGVPSVAGWGSERVSGSRMASRHQPKKSPPASKKAWVSKRSILWLLLLVLFVGIVVYAGYWVTDWLSVPEVSVPDVVGERLSTAESVLAEHGLRAEVVASTHDDEVPANYVLSQNPPANRDIRRGQSVQLTISEGPEWIEGGVPEVVGMSRTEAIVALENVGLQVTYSESYDDEKPSGQVITQTPNSGARAQRGMEVELVVSKGPEPQPFELPGFIGQEEQAVIERLRDLDLDYKVVREMADFPEGIVTAHDPSIGVEVLPGDTVTLVVSKGNEAEANSADLVIPLPSEPEEQEIRVELIDQSSQRVVFHDRLAGDTTLELTVYWYGTAARLFVYSEDVLIESGILAEDDSEDDDEADLDDELDEEPSDEEGNSDDDSEDEPEAPDEED